MTATAHAQWEIEESHTASSLRGIHNVGAGVAWASGTNGTVLRTEDGGYLWQTCSIPPGAEKLDFRGIQAFDENTAIVMSSGPGDQSRLYKTTDGCQTWKLLFTNPDKDGFWDAIQFEANQGLLLGDPVNHQFSSFVTKDGGLTWQPGNAKGLQADPKRDGIFAASNTSMVTLSLWHRFFVTGGLNGAYFIECDAVLEVGKDHDQTYCDRRKLPLAASESAGAFSMARGAKGFVVVGGDYKHTDITEGTAVYELTFDNTDFKPSETSPHGYRSAVAYDATTKSWITVGPNGTDISTDDGRNWRPLTPSSLDQKDADKNWNALSLPFVVGSKGRIGKLRTNALANPVAK